MMHQAGGEAMVAMPVLPQDGEVFVGPGAKKEAEQLGLGLTKLSSRRKDDLKAAKRYAMDISIKQIMLRQQKTHQENQQKQAMYAQALSLMSRVYIGSISFEVREEMIKKAFENYGPIKSINMSWDPTTGHHKGFAFLEFEVPEAALLAQESMNGQMMGGRNLKVGRPSNMPQAQPIIEMVQQDAKRYFRVYVSSVHPDLSETDLKSVFEAFGVVMKCQLARQNNAGKGIHRGFGYIEFDNESSMKEAISGMNMFDLGGQFLRVGRCITPPEALTYLTPSTPAAIPAAAAVAAAAVTARVMAAEASGSGTNSPGPNSRGQSPAPASAEAVKSKVRDESPMKTETPPVPGSPMVMDSPLRFEDMKFEKMDVDSPPAVPSPIPPVIVAPPPAVAPPPLCAQPSTSEPTVAPTPAQPPPPTPPQVVQPRRSRGFGGFANDVPAVGGPTPNLVAPSIGVTTPQVVVPPPAAVQEPKKPKGPKSFNEKLTNLLDKQKNKADASLAGPTTFGAVDPLWAPKDPLEVEKEKEESLKAIAARGDVHSLALALSGDNALALKAAAAKKEAEGDGKKGKKDKYRKPWIPEAKKIQPKLSTAAALVAASKAGEISDAVKNEVMASEDATLASQEGVEIRGNDARHLLMTKLLRTNRSTVLILRNMITPEDMSEDGNDEELEMEVREECEKFGTVHEVVFARDDEAGIVKVFVRYGLPNQVTDAKAVFDGRFFAGRAIKADVYDQALFDHGDLTG